MKYLIIGDVHISDTPPGSRKDTWKNDILKKLDYIVALAGKHKVDAILQLGDLFHRPGYNQNSVELIQQTHDSLVAAKIPVLIVAGNHEMRHNRVDDVDKHALGALGRMRGITLLSGRSEHFPDVFAIPYLQDWQELPSWFVEYNNYRAKNPDIKRGIVMMHAPIFPDSKCPPYDYIAASDVANMIEHETLVSYGHIHDPEGLWQPIADKPVYISNFGAISRGSLHKETMKRKPEVFIYDTETGKHRAYKVPVQAPENVFNLDVVELKESRESRISSFLEGVGGESSTITTIDEMVERIKSNSGVDEQVSAVVADLLEFSQSS